MAVTERPADRAAVEPERTSRFLRSTAISIVMYIATTVLSIGINVVVARAYGPAGKGAYALLVLFSVTVSLIINLGLGQSAVYYIGRRETAPGEAAGMLLSVALVLGTLTAALLALTAPWYANRLFDHLPATLVALIALLTPFALARVYAEYLFAAVHDFFWNSALNLLDLGLRVPLLIVASMLGFGLMGMGAAIAATTIVSAVVGWVILMRRFGTRRPRVEREPLRRFTRYGVRSYASVFMTYLNLRFDQFLVGFFLSLSDVGVYSVAVVVAEVTMKLANVITKVLFANVATLDAESATRLTSRTLRVTLVFAVMTSAALIVVGPVMIEGLFGQSFAAAVTPLWYLVPGTVLFNVTQILYSDLAGRGKPESGLHASAASLAVTLGGNILLTPRLGVVGAALTSSLAYGVGAAVILHAYVGATGQSAFDLFWITSEDLRVARRTLVQCTQSVAAWVRQATAG